MTNVACAINDHREQSDDHSNSDLVIPSSFVIPKIIQYRLHKKPRARNFCIALRS
jgi:hypothetical protein